MQKKHNQSSKICEVSGLCISGRTVNSFRYADDKERIAENPDDLQNLMSQKKHQKPRIGVGNRYRGEKSEGHCIQEGRIKIMFQAKI